ncbi:MAG: outer membrane beta-barrel family protein [Bacteroidota bacterium]
MRLLLLLGVLALASPLLGRAVPTAEFELRGTIVSALNEQALEYATISVFNIEEELLEGTVSDEAGQFSLRLNPGRYLLRVEFLGFQSQELNVDFDTHKDLGTIAMQADAATLETAEVRAEKTQMNLLLDKKVFNVGSDLLSTSGSAEDVLGQLPSVAVNAEGQISLRGNDGVRILVNGRPSALAENNGLAAISADRIDRVEIITNPSARYEAAGTAGIINIILKKDESQGYGGTVNLSVGYPANHRAAVNLNFTRPKYTAFVNAGARYANFRGTGDLTRNSSLDGTESNLLQIADQDRNDRVVHAFTGLDYNFNPKSTLSGSYSIYYVVNDDIMDRGFEYMDAQQELTDNWNQVLDYLEPGTYQQLDLTYTKELARAGEKLTLYLKNDLWEETETEKVNILRTFPEAEQLLNYRTQTIESSRDHLLQADYEFPIGERAGLEMGLRGETRIISSDYLVEDAISGTWTTLAGFNNELDYFERIGSAYAQYQYKNDQWALQLGLRNEYTLVKVESKAESIADVRKTYNRLFPSFSLAYTMSETSSMQLTTSRRIRRPSFWQLNPFRGLGDPNTLFIGDPDLDPTYTDRVELNFVQRWPKFTLNPAIYGSRATDIFQFVVEQEANNPLGLTTGTILTRPINLGLEYRYGLEVLTTYRPNDVWTISGEWHYYGYEQEGQFEDRNFDFQFATWSGRLRLQTTLPGDLKLQGSFYYEARYKDVQSIRRARYDGNLGISKQWNKKLTITLNTMSPRWRRSELFRPTFTQDDYFAWTTWRTSLSLQYRFERGAASDQRRQRGSIR